MEELGSLRARNRSGKDTEVVAILDYRKSVGRVRDFIENLYISDNYSLPEKLTYARNTNFNPYPAQIIDLNVRSPYYQITCGDNPCLFGRLVKNIRISVDTSGKEILLWDEFPTG